jgi:lipoprotein-anchoring transpeptidase ErfK/SrfK
MLRDLLDKKVLYGWEYAMRRLAFMVACSASLYVALSAGASADIVVRIDKSSQSMSVTVDGQHRYTWAVSTGVGGTPSGTYRPQALSRNHRSNLYNGAPMPYSIFYSGNFAIHGMTHIAHLGSRASHGCVRLHPTNAAVLFGLVQKEMGSTRIVIQ